MESTTFFASKFNRQLGALVLVSAAIALLVFAHATWKNTEYRFSGPTIINIDGEGEVLAVPDIGSFSFSVQAAGDDAATAQEASATAVNTILAYLEEEGVAEQDIKTQNYNLYPQYTYAERVCPAGSFCPPGERSISGYEVTQGVTVKVRDLDNSGTLIGGVGERGATNISSLQFTIDDQSELESEARALAIADAEEKANELAAQLGMRVSKIVSFNEGGSGYPQPYMARAMMDGLGGAEDMSVSPEVPVGENTIRSNVNIAFELK